MSASRRGAGGGWHPASAGSVAVRTDCQIGWGLSTDAANPRGTCRQTRACADARVGAHTRATRVRGQMSRGGDTRSSHAGAAYQTRQPARERAECFWGAPRRAFARARCGGVHPTSALNTPSDKAARVKRAVKPGLSAPLPEGSSGRLPCPWRDPLRVPLRTHTTVVVRLRTLIYFLIKS
jgi:hypothetical protein